MPISRLVSIVSNFNVVYDSMFGENDNRQDIVRLSSYPAFWGVPIMVALFVGVRGVHGTCQCLFLIFCHSIVTLLPFVFCHVAGLALNPHMFLWVVVFGTIHADDT